MSQTSPNPTDQSATNRRDIKPLFINNHIGDHATIRRDNRQPKLIYTPQHLEHQGQTRHWWQGLSFRAKAVALAIACLTLPVLANRTSAYYITNQSIPEQTTQAKQAGATAPVDTASVPQRQLPLTLMIETGVAVLLLVGLIAAYLANRAMRPTLTAAATANKLNKRKLDSADMAFARLANQFDKEKAGLLKQQKADPKQASLAEQQEAYSERAQILINFNLRIRQSMYMEDILKTTVKEVRRVLKTDRVVIYALDPTSWEGLFVAESVAPDWPQLLGVRMRDPGFSERYLEMYKSGHVSAINNIYQESGLTDSHIRILEQFAVKANLVAPILRHGELLALMIAHHCCETRIWDKSDVDLFAQLATQVGIAVDQANLLEEQEAAVERAQLITEITRRIQKSLYLEDILKTTVREVRRVLKTDRVVIYGLDHTNWDGVIVAESVAPGWPQMLKVRIYDPCFRERHLEMYNNGQVRAINDIHHEPGLSDSYIKMLEQFAVKANLIAPIRKNDQLLALLIAHHCCEPRIWDKSDVDLFAQVATQAGIAIDQLSFRQMIEQQQAR